MINQQGFSLIEVLIALLLITGTSLILLHQQWQLSRLFSRVLIQSQTLVQRDNDRERGAIVLTHRDSQDDEATGR